MKLSLNEMTSRVRQLYKIADELSQATGRSFKPDGHMVGSIGEVFAAEMYGLDLLPQSAEKHDARKGKLNVQIKATGGNRGVALSSQPEHLLVLKIENGNASEVFNGPGKLVWNQVGELQKNGQRQISLAKLRDLMSDVSEQQKLKKRK